MKTENINIEKSIDIAKIVQRIEENIPHLSVDCAILGFHNEELKILLSKFPIVDLWALQGGFVHQTEDIDDAAKRVLEERTGLTDIFLKQFHVFGKANRPLLEHLKLALKDTPLPLEKIPSLQKRFIAIGYYSLVDFSKVLPKAGIFFERSQWFNINELPPLAFDHEEIIQKALETLRLSLDYSLVGFNLMPETFTMGELQKLYETIVGEQLSRNEDNYQGDSD